MDVEASIIYGDEEEKYSYLSPSIDNNDCAQAELEPF